MDLYSKRIESWARVGMCLSFATAVMLLANGGSPSGPDARIAGKIAVPVAAEQR